MRNVNNECLEGVVFSGCVGKVYHRVYVIIECVRVCHLRVGCH